MTAYMFYIESIVWGYYDYQSIRDNPLTDGDLLCEREMENSHNLKAVAIKKTINGTLQVIGHVQTKVYSISLIFLKRGGSITLTWDFTIDV